MKRTGYRLWILGALLLAANLVALLWIDQRARASARERARIVRVSPSGNAREASVLRFEFENEIAPAGDLGQELTGSPFTWSPAIPGRWYWGGPRELEFRLEAPLPLGRMIRARLSADGERVLGLTLDGPREFEFRTGALKWEQTRLIASDNQNVSFELRFDQPVITEDVLRRISVDDGGGVALEPFPLEREADETVALRVPRPPSDEIRIYLSHDLCGRDGELPLGVRPPDQLEVPAGFGLLSTRITQPRLGRPAEIHLRFNEPLSPDLSGAEIQVDPPVTDLDVSAASRRLILRGPFDPQTRYVVSVGPDLWNRDGESLGRRLTRNVIIPAPPPQLWFADSRGQLSPRGNLLIDLGVCGISNVLISASRVHPNNIVAHLVGEGPEFTSRPIAETSYEIGPSSDHPQIHQLALRELVDQPLGVYRFHVRDPENRWRRAQAIVTVSDLGLTVRRSPRADYVWVTSLRDGVPIQGVRVRGFTRNNQDLMSALTDENGLAVLPVDENHPDGRIWAIVAEKGRDLNYIAGSSWNPRELADKGTRPRRRYPENYETFVYTDRGVYRPGEALHVGMILRDPKGGTPEPFPLEVDLIRPDGLRLSSPRRISFDSQGMADWSSPIPADAPLGSYRLQIKLPGAKKPLSSLNFLVDSVTPLRFDMKLSCVHDSDVIVPPGERIAWNVEGQYFTGAPTSNFEGKAEVRLDRMTYRSKRFPEFDFGSVFPQPPTTLPAADLELDQQGRTDVDIELDPELTPGLYRARSAVTLNEPGGRSLTKAHSVRVANSDRFLGLRLIESEKNLDWTAEWTLVDLLDQVVFGATLEFVLERRDQEWVRERRNERTKWVRKEWWSEEKRWKVDAADGQGATPFKIADKGWYRLRALESSSGISCSSARWLGSDQEPSELSPPGQLRMSWASASVAPDRPVRFKPGDRATLRLDSDLRGWAWVTLEADQLLAQQFVDLGSGYAQVDLLVPHSLRGGALVCATQVAPVDPDEADWKPHRARHALRLEVDHENARPSLTIQAPEEARPGDEVDIVVVTDPQSQRIPARVHVFAVDEALLALTDEPVPDPFGFFLAPRRSLVEGGDVFDALLPDHLRTGIPLAIGGDLDAMQRRRRGEVTRETRPSIIWESSRPVPVDGKLRYRWTLPELSGGLRVVALLADGDSYANAVHTLKVRSPQIIEMPSYRIVAPGDRFEIPIRVINTEDRPARVSLSHRSSGVEPHLPELIEVGAKSHLDLAFPWVAEDKGDHEFRLIATSDSSPPAQIEKALTVRVRPVSTLSHRAWMGAVQAGERLELDFAKLEGFSEVDVEQGRCRIEVSGNPRVSLEPALSSVTSYPYGCLEQTTSRLWAVLASHQWRRTLASEGSQDRELEFLDQRMGAGMTRLWSMQSDDGWLGYWSGQRTRHVWGSLYAASFLLHAEDRGLEIDPRFLNPLVDAIHRGLADGDNEWSPRERAQACWVLARADRPHLGWMNRLYETRETLDLEGRSRLARAWLRQDDPGRAIELIDVASFESRGPDSALEVSTPAGIMAEYLECLMDFESVEPDSQAVRVAKTVEALEAQRGRSGHWGSTYTNGRVISALLRYQSSFEPGEFSGTLRIDDEEEDFDHEEPYRREFAFIPETLRLKTEGEGKVFVSAVAEGWIREDAVRHEDRGLQVRFQYRDVTSGKPIDLDAVELGDLIWVDIDIKALERSSVPYVAILMLLPGCLECDRPRLSTSSPFSREESRLPGHHEFLDDRVLLFDSIPSRGVRYSFGLRVMSKGRFRVPPVQASCMYNESIRSTWGPDETMWVDE